MINNKVTIEGIDFHLGLGFLAELCEKTEMDLNELGEEERKNILLFVPKIMLHSANYANKRNGKNEVYDIDFFYDKIDELGGATCRFFIDFYSFFVESMVKHVPQQEHTEDKKKVKK
jgi:hypothetical protein